MVHWLFLCRTEFRFSWPDLVTLRILLAPQLCMVKNASSSWYLSFMSVLHVYTSVWFVAVVNSGWPQKLVCLFCHYSNQMTGFIWTFTMEDIQWDLLESELCKQALTVTSNLQKLHEIYPLSAYLINITSIQLKKCGGGFHVGFDTVHVCLM